MPGWWISRSRQNSRHRLRAMERSEVWSSSGARSEKYSTSRSRTGLHSMPYPSTICATLRRPSIRSARNRDGAPAGSTPASLSRA